MNWQKRLCGTVGGRMGLPIIDGPHPYFRMAHGAREEPIPLTERKPSRPPPPPPGRRGPATIEIFLEDEGVEVVADSRPASQKPKAPPDEAPRPSAESAAFSLSELVAAATGKKKPAPIPKPDTRQQESSVMRTLAELQELERERVAEEAAAKAEKEADAKSLEANLRRLVEDHRAEVMAEAQARERSLLDSLDDIQALGREKAAEEGMSLLSVLDEAGAGPAMPEAAGPAAPAKAAAMPETSVFLVPGIIEPEVEPGGEISISIEFAAGLPWGDAHATYNLSGKELETLEALLPERLRTWVIPAPDAKSTDRGERMTLEQFAEDQRVQINGKEYYFTMSAFAGARNVMRVGDLLHIWHEASTDYDMLGEVSGEVGLGQPRTGEWSLNMKAHILSREELFKCSALLPDGKPVFIHPVPESESQLALEKSMMESLHEGRIPRITLGKKEYFVMNIGTVAEWQEIAFMFPNVRIASRKGEWLGIWPDGETGREMMSPEYGFGHAFHGQAGPPLLDDGVLVKPHETELAQISRLYGKTGEKRWLYPLPQKISEMDSDTLNFLTVISCREIELGGITPLISLNGRFYVSLKYAHPEARASSFENGMVRVHPKHVKLRDALAEVKRKAAERKEARETPMIVLPPDPAQRKPLLDMFPEGKVKYLYYVEPANTGYVPHRPHVTLMRGTEKETYLVLDSPQDNSIAVKRKGIAIYPVQ
ncbi:hypothetical protein L0Y65_04320 [Candidatus Micrarchaeota archaeon]|nr:hypothetical protein [Candidatus Micrarchaeota archaeon]